MGWRMWYTVPYEGDEVRYFDSAEEVLEAAEEVRKNYPFEDVGLTICKVEQEWDLTEFKKAIENKEIT